MVYTIFAVMKDGTWCSFDSKSRNAYKHLVELDARSVDVIRYVRGEKIMISRALLWSCNGNHIVLRGSNK